MLGPYMKTTASAVSKTMILNQKTEFGDYQTPITFAEKVCRLIKEKYEINPSVILEPTMGEGAFLLAGKTVFPSAKRIIGVDINRHYVESFKAKHHSDEFSVFCDDIFKFDFGMVKSTIGKNDCLLCIGNPPWATNSSISGTGGTNLPVKTNFKKESGFSAISGKSNFDIAEYILLSLFESFSDCHGSYFAFLCKDIVARNVFRDLSMYEFGFSVFDVFRFDSKKVFNVSASAVLLVCRISDKKDNVDFASLYDIGEAGQANSKFGYIDGNFVLDVDAYRKTKEISGISEMTWRQGIKHDCAKVMELSLKDGRLFNGFGDDVDFLRESKFVFPLVKSSSIKGGILQKFDRYVIVTQRKTGEDTKHIADEDPVLWNYLVSHDVDFASRKSIIYKKAPRFSIFGIGDYSFAKYKIAVSGLYKRPLFTYLKSEKPVMADDTCYFLFTDDGKTSFVLFALMSSKIVTSYLLSVCLIESKRPFTKETLKTISILKLAKFVGYKDIAKKVFEDFGVSVNESEVEAILSKI
jgi:hypothetical protein